jgi:hypothetical protein
MMFTLDVLRSNRGIATRNLDHSMQILELSINITTNEIRIYLEYSRPIIYKNKACFCYGGLYQDICLRRPQIFGTCQSRVL